MPEINMPATTALSVKDRDGYRKGLSCGANVIMPNMGLSEYKKLYAVYPGKGEGFARSDEQMVKIQTVLQKLGRKVGQGYGFRVGR
jgi:biotin synthase